MRDIIDIMFEYIEKAAKPIGILIVIGLIIISSLPEKIVEFFTM